MTGSTAPDAPLLYAVADGIATLTLNQPDKLNALTDVMVDDFVTAIANAQRDAAVRVIVVTGAGRGFCSGADTGRMGDAQAITPSGVRNRLQQGLQRIPLALAECDKPVIAALNGAAAGAGLDIALACDVRFAVAGAKLAETYAKLGLVPGAGGAYFLPRLVGTAKALELLWTAEFILAEDAVAIGLINQVFADQAALQAGTLAFARKIAAAPPLSVRLIKRAVYNGLSMNVQQGLDLISAYLGIARTSADHAEAMAAMREKRPGNFTGS